MTAVSDGGIVLPKPTEFTINREREPLPLAPFVGNPSLSRYVTISKTMLGAQVRRIAHVLSESLSCGEHHFRCCRALRLPLGDIYLPTQSRVRNPALWQMALGLLLSRSAKCYETASKQ